VPRRCENRYKQNPELHTYQGEINNIDYWKREIKGLEKSLSRAEK